MAQDTSARDAEIRRRVEAGESERAIARAVGCSRSTVWSVKQRTAGRAG